MAKRLGNAGATQFWDNEAVKHVKRAADLDGCADRTRSVKIRRILRRVAREERAEQTACLERAKVADAP